MKTSYLAYHRAHGKMNNPFLEADRREAAKREAAARRCHPALLLPSILQPSTQAAGLSGSSGMPVIRYAQLTAWSSEPSSVPSIFSTPAAAPVSTISCFTPSASAPISNLVGSTGFSPRETSYVTASPSPFWSAQNPSQLGVTTQYLDSSPAVGRSPFPSTSSSAPISNLFSSTGFSPQAHFVTASPSPLWSAQNPSQVGSSVPSSTPAVGKPPTSSSVIGTMLSARSSSAGTRTTGKKRTADSSLHCR